MVPIAVETTSVSGEEKERFTGCHKMRTRTHLLQIVRHCLAFNSLNFKEGNQFKAIELCFVQSLHSCFQTATQQLTPIKRNATSLTIRYVPRPGISGYSLTARNPNWGSTTANCNPTTCEIGSLPPGTAFTLWLRTCLREHWIVCDLEALPYDIFTPPMRMLHWNSFKRSCIS